MAVESRRNDANYAAAICKAAGRPHMRFVPVKTPEQQGQLSVHRLREGYRAERTALVSRIRSVPAEYGPSFLQGPESLRRVQADALEDAGNELTATARLVLQRAHLHWNDLDLQMQWCDERIEAHACSDERAVKAAALQGIGPVGVAALMTKVSDLRQFASAKQFDAWLGLVPGQNSTGGEARLGRITKRGNDHLRITLANKNARIMCAHQIGSDMVRPEYGACLAKGPAPGRLRPARYTDCRQTQ